MKKYLFFILFITLLCLGANAQKSATPTDTSIHLLVENMPMFPGGEEKMYAFINRHMIYPDSAIKVGISGKVIVKFIVEKDGSISHVEAVKGPGWGLNEEAVRIVKLMPKFIPGTQNGNPVKVTMLLPIRFELKN